MWSCEWLRKVEAGKRTSSKFCTISAIFLLDHICLLQSLFVILFKSMIIKDTITTYIPFSGISCTSSSLQSRLAFSLELRFAFLKTVTALKFCFHQGGDTMVHWCHLEPKRPEKLFLRLVQHSPVFCRWGLGLHRFLFNILQHLLESISWILTYIRWLMRTWVEAQTLLMEFTNKLLGW